MTSDITEKFYDAETGDLIEIEDGVVINVHKSVFTKKERLAINEERAQQLVTQQAMRHSEQGWVSPLENMFTNEDQIAHAGAGNIMAVPELTWDKPKPKPNYSGQGATSQDKQSDKESGYVAPVMEW